MTPAQRPIVFIMAGGSGTRFWPLSTEVRPKQFIPLLDEKTLLQHSYERVASLTDLERIFVLTHERFSDLVLQQLPQLPASNIVAEPLRRDTAAAVALAALICQHRFGSSVMAILTSDHHITPHEQFHRSLLSAMHGAAQSRRALYTFGIRPTYPATGYGYLHRGERLNNDHDTVAHYRVREFREKPNRDTAELYLETGDYLWNSGMFVWSTEAILTELDHHLPKHLSALRPAIDADRTPQWSERLRQAFETLHPISIDFAVMENAEDVRCVEATFSWSDVGSWLSLRDYLTVDDHDNAYRGQLHTLEATRNLVYSEDPSEHVAILGVDNIVVVRTGTTTLIVDRDRTEDIKLLVKKLPATLQ